MNQDVIPENYSMIESKLESKSIPDNQHVNTKSTNENQPIIDGKSFRAKRQEQERPRVGNVDIELRKGNQSRYEKDGQYGITKPKEDFRPVKMDQNRDSVQGNITLGMKQRKPAQLSDRALQKEIWPMDFKSPVDTQKLKPQMRSKQNKEVEFIDKEFFKTGGQLPGSTSFRGKRERPNLTHRIMKLRAMRQTQFTGTGTLPSVSHQKSISENIKGGSTQRSNRSVDLDNRKILAKTAAEFHNDEDIKNYHLLDSFKLKKDRYRQMFFNDNSIMNCYEL